MKTMMAGKLRWTLVVCGLLASALAAETLVLPVEAIADSGRLSAAEFAERHPGIDLAGGVPEVEGYFIRYRHENLVYLFGPVAARAEAERWRLELEVIRDRAVAVRPALRSSTVDLFEFRFEALAEAAPAERPAPSADSVARPVPPRPAVPDASAPPASPSAQPPVTAPPADPADATPGPPGKPEPGLWALIRRIFGGR